MDLLIDALLDWIGSHSDYDIRAVPRPAVVTLSPQELTREYYSGAPQLIPRDGIDDRVQALYAAGDGAHGTLYLLAPAWLPGAEGYADATENPAFREMLLHELVHHLQWQSGAPARWACPAEGEAEAYRLGGTFLHEIGAEDPMPNRTFWAAIYARC